MAGPEGESKKVNTNGYKIEYTSRYDDYNLEVIPELSGWKDYITPLNVYELSKYDLVVISTGSHWRRSSSGIDVSSKKSVFNAVQERILALSKLNVKTRIIWKGPDVNHWSQDVRYNPWNKPCANRTNAVLNDNLQLWIREALTTLSTNSRVEFFDVYNLTSSRPDAHPQDLIHMNEKYDCLHWCLPGVPDVWNSILFSFLCPVSS